MTTATASFPTSLVPAPTADQLVRFTLDQYHEMVRAGILEEDEAIELLDGWLVSKMPKNPRHRAATRLLQDALTRLVPDGWYVDSQEPITLANSEPEPDVVVVRGETREYLDRHPGPQEVGLVVEVADTSLERDRAWKLRIYATAAIPEYWIVNLVDDQIEVYRDPAGPTYRTREDFRSGDAVPVSLDGRPVGAIRVRDVIA